MNCDLASHLIDDYLENQLSQRDRHCLEEHFSRCSRCVAELYRRPAFERDVRQALAASVLPFRMSPVASRRIIQASEDSFRRAVRLNGVVFALRATAGVLAAVLLVVGLLFLLGRILGPSQLESVSLLPSIKFLLSGQRPVTLPTEDQPVLQSTSTSLASWTDGDLLVEPLRPRAGEPFTMTVLLNSDMPEPLDNIHLNLDISGPTGYYHFVMAIKGPLPAHGVSVLRVTPDLLTTPCQEQYLISPVEIFGTPGVYDVRVTLSARLPPPQ
jgi:hypothetical protein